MSNDNASQQAAEKAVDADRLLPGEARDSDDPEDARLWVAAYGELLDFKQRMLDETHRMVASDLVTEPARQEVSTTDLTILEAETERFRRRLAFWRSRMAELEA